MLHLVPHADTESRPVAHAEAVSRLASVRHALRLVDGFGGGPASDLDDDDALTFAWDDAGEARQHWFDKKSAQLVSATAAGLEALLDERKGGHEPHAQANRFLVDEIRRELREVAGVVLR